MGSWRRNLRPRRRRWRSSFHSAASAGVASRRNSRARELISRFPERMFFGIPISPAATLLNPLAFWLLGGGVPLSQEGGRAMGEGDRGGEVPSDPTPPSAPSSSHAPWP